MLSVKLETLAKHRSRIQHDGTLARKSLNSVTTVTIYIKQRFGVVPEECLEQGIKIPPRIN